MKKNNHKIVILAAGTFLFCMTTAKPKTETIQPIDADLMRITETVDHKIHEKIKLTNNSVPMLNISLQQNPIAVLKIRLSAKAVRQVLNSLPAEKKKKEALLKSNLKTNKFVATPQTVTPTETAFITKQLDAILKPVEQFFDIIQQYSGMVLPILKESMTNHNLLEKSFLVEYFSAQEHIKEFSAKKANSFENLETLCNELISFFNDLDASFSPEVEAAYKDLVKQLKAPKVVPAV